MWVIQYQNTENNKCFRLYRFTKSAMEVLYLLNNTYRKDNPYELRYEVYDIFKCDKTWKAFKKCFKKYSQELK